jgi:hypothetical protein
MDPSRRPRYCSPEIYSNTWRNQTEETKAKIVDTGSKQSERRGVEKATNVSYLSWIVAIKVYLLFEHVVFVEKS